MRDKRKAAKESVMSSLMLRSIIVSSALALAACASGPPPAEVTRFHLNQPLSRGVITVEPLPGQDQNSLEFNTYASAVGAELARVGFNYQPDLKGSELVAVTGVDRGIRPGITGERSPVSIGIGGGTFGRNVGIGLGTSFGVGKKRSNDIESTLLSVQIKRRSDSSVIWEGRAQMEDRGNRLSPDDAVGRLARALFQDFPGESGRTVSVPLK